MTMPLNNNPEWIEFQKKFKYKDTDSLQRITCDLIRDAAMKMGEAIFQNVPPGPEREVALERTLEAMYWSLNGVRNLPPEN